MGMYINSASSSLGLVRSLYKISTVQSTAMKRLSSGIRINSASDDAAGLSLSQKLTSVINGNKVAKDNAQTGIAFLNTADSSIASMTSSLERIRNLAVQSANGVYTTTERQMLQKEISQLSSDISQSYHASKFSDKNVFKGDVSVEYAAATQAGYNDAHIITSAQEFVSKISADLGGTFVLAGDIDMGQLGTLTNSAITGVFTGTLNGNGHTVQNLSIDTGGAAVHNIGLFSQSSGTIQNLSLNNVSINAIGSNKVGGLVGRNTGGNINNCIVSGDIKALNETGGMIGYNFGAATISNCNASVSLLSMTGSAGGLLGINSGGTIKDSTATGSVSGSSTWDLGGFIGGNYTAGIIQNCSASVNVIAVASAISNVGGFAGSNIQGGNITNCYSTGTVNAKNNTAIGGFVGAQAQAGSSITSCYTTSNVYATYAGSELGGFIGTLIAGVVDASNFFQTNLSKTGFGGSAAVNENISSSRPQDSWSSAIWDKTTSLPTLKNSGAALTAIYQSTTSFQIGDDSSATSQVGTLSRMLLGDVNFDVSSISDAQASINKIDKKMGELNSYRSEIGAAINKFSSVMEIQSNRINNLSGSRSTIKDSDIASESATLVKNQISQQSSVALLSQVNSLNSDLLMMLIG